MLQVVQAYDRVPIAEVPTDDGASLETKLEAAYRQRPVSVINLIAAPPDPVQGLADAFKFRGEK